MILECAFSYPSAGAVENGATWTEAEKRLQEQLLQLQEQKAHLQKDVLALQTRETDMRLEIDAARREVVLKKVIVHHHTPSVFDSISIIE